MLAPTLLHITSTNVHKRPLGRTVSLDRHMVLSVSKLGHLVTFGIFMYIERLCASIERTVCVA